MCVEGAHNLRLEKGEKNQGESNQKNRKKSTTTHAQGKTKRERERERKATNKHVKGGALVQSLTETIHSLVPSNFPSSHSLQQNTHKISFLFPIFYPSYFTPN